MKIKSILKLIAITSLPFYFSACDPKPEKEFDPNYKFFEAYSLAGEADGLEFDGDDRMALANFHKALSILNEIKKNNPEWNPMIVEYHYGKIREDILRLEQNYAHRAFERYLKYKAENSSK